MTQRKRPPPSTPPGVSPETLDRLRNHQGPRITEEMMAGEELGLRALAPIDLSQCKTHSQLLAQMRNTSFAGRQLGKAADILETMVRDEGCLVVGTFSGAMTVAKQGLVLCDMIDHGMLDIVVSTGALMAHGLVEAAGMSHFEVPAELNDRELYYAGFDRVYDTLEVEKNLDDIETIFARLLDSWDTAEPACSRTLCEMLGRHLLEHQPERGILKSAVAHDVPVYVPAFTDSELGLDFALANRHRRDHNMPVVAYDPFLDLESFTERVSQAERLGIFTIGGGVPRNWAQQVCPYIDLIATRQGYDGRLQRYRYGVRICPEPAHWGGLSGCTYEEGISWGKFVPPADGGRFAEVMADATIAWPLLIAGVLERVR